ncbi:beta/gamma crystallin family protein [Vibrio alginolyticus]|uniref:beta/gamma crystallin-related protein n=1 Tax=Vibrio alginolyticus TaxID=663 RepID=UPI001BD6BCB7|nr:beta/gamma crystallin-related protein [Vibrio alginolyticus]MBT0027690.1 beta/gamma crystallin family protein [Vibrio alginolyticus]
MDTYNVELVRGVNGAISDVDPMKANVFEFPDANVENDVSFLGGHMPEIVIYEHIDFGGANARTNLAWKYVGTYWNDKISSIVIVSGLWDFYEHINYGGRKWTLGPGYYRWVADKGIPNDTISSFKPSKW